MASVSSLDKDLSRLRLAKYSPQLSTEIKEWISEVLGVALPESRDLMECLRDGVLLCRLTNLLPAAPTLKPKSSPMPFVQMEQIAAFLSVCSKPPISLPPHDLFLTVDLFEQKDPAQVVQCLTAFSRVANRLAPDKFPHMIGGKKGSGGLSSPPINTAYAPRSPGGGSAGRRDYSSSSNISGYSVNSSLSPAATTPMFPPNPVSPPPPPTVINSPFKRPPVPLPAKSSTTVSSWSKKTDELKSAPAWNIHQYGYMGGASQGSMGVSFGGRRQITGAAVSVPNLKEKVDIRKKQDEEAARLVEVKKLEENQRKEEERKLKAQEEEAELERERLLWEREENARRQNEEAQIHQESERHRNWQLQQDREREAEFAEKKRRDEAAQRKLDQEKAEREKERLRVRELERELKKARERERMYLMEKEEKRREDVERRRQDDAQWVRDRSTDKIGGVKTATNNTETERKFLQGAWNNIKSSSNSLLSVTPLKPHKTGNSPSTSPTRPMTAIATHRTGGSSGITTHRTGGSGRPLPSPTSSGLAPPTHGDYGNGRLSPRPLTPHRTGDWGRPTTPGGSKFGVSAVSSSSAYTPSAVTSRDLPQPRALPTPPRAKPQLPPRDPVTSSPTKSFPASKYFTAQRPPATKTSSSASLSAYSNSQPQEERENSWEHDTATVIDVPTSPGSVAAAAQRQEEERRQKAYRWANMSFLEREREMERQRQKEWEKNQQDVEKRAIGGATGKLGEGGMVGDGGVGWDVHQYGYMGGANQGSEGVAFGARRQIIGPRGPR